MWLLDIEMGLYLILTAYMQMSDQKIIEYKTHLEAVNHLNQIIEEYLQLKYFSIIDLQGN